MRRSSDDEYGEVMTARSVRRLTLRGVSGAAAGGGLVATTIASYGGTPETPWGLLLVGSYLCHRGITTGYRCGDVTSNEYVPTWSGACNGVACKARFVRVDAAEQVCDSGGPWFWTNGTGTNRAYGIHKGGGVTFSVFSKLQYVPGSTRPRYNF